LRDGDMAITTPSDAFRPAWIVDAADNPHRNRRPESA
jgi:hypothetical protein